eukprot:2591577-Rhodomonas_salina.2
MLTCAINDQPRGVPDRDGGDPGGGGKAIQRHCTPHQQDRSPPSRHGTPTPEDLAGTAWRCTQALHHRPQPVAFLFNRHEHDRAKKKKQNKSAIAQRAAEDDGWGGRGAGVWRGDGEHGAVHDVRR